eukprot:CAMPEP_0117423178 /NCGR_PEP_ID=MMETSP0758-20121206/3857_1 /TAXON_ID=63605 /ORGANISM="Percolomonas cosmopolitus, Strain AE-1 (ATCC 50343)" /LENGTH=741 /DNA_ID=CAMNT_0005206217 /DNA_START=199 /DNA_END=2424 /DNA_ORIENTATION=+
MRKQAKGLNSNDSDEEEEIQRKSEDKVNEDIEKESKKIFEEQMKTKFQVNDERMEKAQEFINPFVEKNKEVYQTILRQFLKKLSIMVGGGKVVSHGGANYTESEQQTFIKYTNMIMEHLREEQWKTIETMEDMFESFKDGTVIADILNFVVPGLIEEKVIKRKAKHTMQQIENQNMIIKACQSLGFVVVNVKPQQMQEGAPGVWLSLFWQILRYDLLNSMSLTNTLELIALKKDDETVKDFLKLENRILLLRWINYVLQEKDQVITHTIKNFGEDFMDGSVLTRLVRSVAPDYMTEEQASTIILEQEPLDRSNKIIEILETLPLDKFIIIQAQDISSGNERLIMAYVANLFKKFGRATLANEFTTNEQKMMDLRCEILDIAVEELAKTQEKVRDKKFTQFVSAAKMLSEVTKSGDEKVGILDRLKASEDAKDALETKLTESMAAFERLQNDHDELKDTFDKKTEEWKTQFDVLKNESANSDDMKKQIVSMHAAHEEALEALQQKMNNKLEEQQVAHDKEKAELTEKIELLEDQNTDKEALIAQLRKQNAELTKKNEELMNKERTQREMFDAMTTMFEDDLDDDEAKKRRQLPIIERVQYLRKMYITVRKELAFAMAATDPPYAIAEKLALYKFRTLSAVKLAPEATHTGILTKRSSGGLVKNWKERFTVLKENYLLYYENAKSTKPKGLLCLDDCDVEVYPKHDCGFLIFIEKRRFKCLAKTPEQRVEWMKHIKRAGAVVF